MPFGAIRPNPLGSVTAPTALVVASPSSAGASFPAWGTCEVASLSSINAIAFFHGSVAQGYVLEGSSLRLGLLAPASGMTATDSGAGSGPAIGSYQYGHQHLRTLDGALSGSSVVSTSILTRTVQYGYLLYTQTVANSVNLAAMTAFVAIDGTDYRRWLRTANGGDVLFKGADVTTTTASDSLTDAVIAGPGAYLYDERKFRLREAGYPVVGRSGILWRNRLWSAGAHKATDYTAGTALFTNGNATVTGSALARFKADMIGRTIQRTANSLEEILIVGVDEATPSLTLARNWPESTNAVGAAYRIRDQRDPFELFYTEPGLFNQSPPTNSFRAVYSRDPSGVMGFATLLDRLIVFTRTNVWVVTGDTGSFQARNVGEGYGCFGGGAIQATGYGLFWLGPGGVFAWSDPDTLPTNISKPLGAEADDGIQGTIDSINADEAPGIVSNYNPSSQKIRWWFPVDDEPTNRRCLRYDLQSRSFALHTAGDVTAALTAPGPGGRSVTITGDVNGCVWQMDTGYSDGAYGFEPVQEVSAWAVATRTLTVIGTALPTSGNGLAGVPVVILPQAGPPYQVATVLSNTSAAVVLTAPLETAPVAGDFALFGAIPLDIETPWFDRTQPELMKWLEAATLAHEVEVAATEVWCGAGADSGVAETYLVTGSTYPDHAPMDEEDGEHHFWLHTRRGRSLKIRFLSFARGYRVRLRGFVTSIRFPLLEEVEG